MKNKITMWCMLFALLVALVPPSRARAEETEKTIPAGTYSFKEVLGNFDLISHYDNWYLNGCKLYKYSEGATGYCYCIRNDSDGWDVLILKGVVSGHNAVSGFSQEYYSTGWNASSGLNYGRGQNVTRHFVLEQDTVVEKAFYDWFVLNVEDVDGVLDDGVYTFDEWCADSGLNCIASSNESDSVIPYSYNNYWHIVRKTSSGKWLLTTVGNSVSQENASDYTFMYSEDMGTLQVLNLYSGEDTNGYLLNVRQYEYDTDGWKVRTYVAYDARETDDCIIDLGAGSGVDDTRVLAYTNVNIYDENFELVTSASTEYTEPTTPESPSEEITPTPTNAPSGGDTSDGSGSGSEGGGTGGGTRPEDGTEEDGTLLENINSMVEMISAVPQIIKAVFSFLPSWCLTLVGIGFAIIVVIMVRRGTIG